MHQHVKTRIEAQCYLANSEGLCMIPDTETDRRLLRRVSRDVSGESPSYWRHAQKKTPEFVSPYPGYYLPGEDWLAMDDDDVSLFVIRTLGSMHPTWVFSLYSAALLHGLDVSWDLLESIHVACGQNHRTRDSLRVMRHPLYNPAGVVKRSGCFATSLKETVTACLRNAPFELALGIVDSALRRKLTTKAELQEYLEAMGKSSKGIVRARKALMHADGRAANGGESRARAVMIEEGFAPHELQIPFIDPLDESHRMYADFGWLLEDGKWILGELDGRQKYENPDMMNGGDAIEVMMQERQREARLTIQSARILRFGMGGVVRRWELVDVLSAYGVPRSSPDAVYASFDW